MQLLIYHGPEQRKPLVPLPKCNGRVQRWESEQSILKSDTVTNELVYECVGAAFKHCFGIKNPPKDIPVNATTFCRMVG